MKSDSQFVRWGIPGWTMAVSFIMFVLIDYVSANDDRMYQVLNAAFGSEAVWNLVLAGFLVAGAGIPLGFLIYQLYFYLRWASPISRNGLPPLFVGGRIHEMDASRRDIKLRTLTFGQKWRRVLLSDEHDHQVIWHYISPLFYEALVAVDRDGTIHKQWSFLKESLHSLGAANLGFILGYVGYLILKWKIGQAPLGALLVLLVLLGSTIALVSGKFPPWLRRRLQIRPANIKAPAELFLASLFFLYCTLNPAINQLVPHQGVWIALVLLGLVWGASARSNMLGIWSIAVVLAFTSAVLYESPGYARVAGQQNWPVILSLLVFCGGLIVFVKIRQNTVDALTAYQYYLTRLFIEKRRRSRNGK